MTARRMRSSRADRVAGSKTSSSTSSVATCSTSWSTRTPTGTPAQRIFVVQREDYVYLVPFVEDEQSVFLKRIIPSRKATKQYLGEESDDED